MCDAERFQQSRGDPTVLLLAAGAHPVRPVDEQRPLARGLGEGDPGGVAGPGRRGVCWNHDILSTKLVGEPVLYR